MNSTKLLRVKVPPGSSRSWATFCTWRASSACWRSATGPSPWVRAQEKAANYHFDWPEVGGVLDKLEEETVELRRAVEDGRRDRIADELGDVLFSLANLARFLKIDPGQALIGTIKKFQERLRWMETRCAAGGVSLTDLDLPELEALWQKAKLQRENDAS
ncbi:MAG: hypothetical protein NTW26_00865 [bacterium]|nr:hypothetical protein [bacterium]